ncbi:MAG: sn-glycerol-1-phosphate dehydrogenase [Clostridia bacterium]|nr:sn-glycerol-1-phosphate dehydrogenase [Clostridia bacterium]
MVEIKETGCACGKAHRCAVNNVIIGKGVVEKLPEEIKKMGATKPFVLCDVNTDRAAGQTVSVILEKAGIPYSKYVIAKDHSEPDEETVGAVFMHFDPSCDLVLAVGSGVIGDVSKIVATVAKLGYMIVATAPSMDGYASATSSMARDGVKVSLPTKCPEVIIGDVDILKEAPAEMLKSGLGDMLAKYISLAEWRIARLLVGEYYCEDIAELMRECLRACSDNADGLLKREDAAVEAVFQGLVQAGLAMSYADCSRPASGVEHYFSHVWDMRALEFGDACSTHGIQVAIGTLYSARLYEKLKTVTPDVKKGIASVEAFSKDGWFEELSGFLGSSAQAMIRLDAKEQKYDPETHKVRLVKIVENWDEILRIIDEEIPTAAELEALLDRIECPKRPSEIGIDEALLPITFKATKDIRDKYILPRLLWDLGLLDEMADTLA